MRRRITSKWFVLTLLKTIQRHWVFQWEWERDVAEFTDYDEQNQYNYSNDRL